MRDRAEAADHLADAAAMRAEAAMHGDAAHAVILALSREVARYILDHARREDALAIECAAGEQHLIEGRHGARRSEAAARWHPRVAEGDGVLGLDQLRTFAALAGIVHLGGARLVFFFHQA